MKKQYPFEELADQVISDLGYVMTQADDLSVKQAIDILHLIEKRRMSGELKRLNNLIEEKG